ncbi:HesB/YadR/YfhF family protein [Cytobacillus sp. S13-E01]|uniref:HesB/YadR/YfhF family protein n=1 Tax=Cytobacillus sp. S13-E01 TaxID=3031326 RepID=UPI0023D8502D|nr:HesB/YadR/YfhF family protein [Cytobacillus sp. S13-E01]MDF0727994.1 HesB/YadR/YfhF family protein [Cytobacillus sp. S13-E01]
MQFTISDKAAKWYKSELNLSDGNEVRFYVRYGGYSPIQSGFSLGVSIDEPETPAIQAEEEGITFFVEEKDLWYFDNHNLNISYNEKKAEPEFTYSKAN